MNRTLTLVATIGLALLMRSVVNAADEKPAKTTNPKLVKIFTAAKPLKLDDAVAEFVIDLIHKNIAGVQDQYRKLTSATEEAAGGRYATHPFQGIEWFVIENTFHVGDKGFESSNDAIYLARQQLVAGFHGGYGVPANVIGKVHVETTHSGKGDGPKVKEGWVGAGAKVKLSFEGFLDSVPVLLPQ